MSPQTVEAPQTPRKRHVEKTDRVVVRLAGDSGDGIQLRVQKHSIASLMPKGTVKGDL